MLWLIAIVLGLMACAFILAPLLFERSRTYSDERADINLSLYRERINDSRRPGTLKKVPRLNSRQKKRSCLILRLLRNLR